jgi:signal transduction histidine kinase/ActR/RegA family two-component response regulator
MSSHSGDAGRPPGPAGAVPASQRPDFRILFEAVPGAYCVLDPDLVIIAATDAYLRDTRTSRPGIVGRPLTRVFPDRPDPSALATLRASLDIVRSDQVANTIAVNRYDIPAAGPGGEPDARYWSLVNVPVPGPGRRLGYIIHWLDDVTDYVRTISAETGGEQPAGAQQGRVQRIEADLLALSQALQQGNRALQEANESLRGAYNAKKDFLDRLSHELRTPLHTILGFGELLSLDGLSAEHREWITMMLRASRHLVQLMDEAGDVAQIENRTLTLSMEAVPVHGVIADVIEMIRPLALAEGVQIDPPPRPATSQYIRADEQRFRQIMLNLLSNAVKYNYPGGRVTITVTDQPGDQLRVSVTDTGRGVAGQDVGRLFLPFERLDAAAAGVEGAGLGLALSRDLIEAMEGTTGVTSIQGEGSTFWIELPVTEPVAVSQLAIERDVIVSAREYATGKTVLYVEDMVENFRLVEQILKQRPSVTLLPAMLAGVALDLARQHRPDMILLDLRLPDMPGEEVLLRLRADSRTRDIPVVILSADATRQRIDQLRADGVVDYLIKPIDVRSLLRTVDCALGEAQPGPGSPAGETQQPALVRRIYNAHYYR